MNLLLVDDEKLALDALKNIIGKVLPNATINAFQRSTQAVEFARDNRIDIAFLDIDMRIMNGLEMAKALQEIYHKTNIIFVTGYSEYALDAFDLYASAYLTKPASEEAIQRAVGQLRYPVETKRVRFQCFGNFEVYCDNKPMKFSLNRTKELLAYLVDRGGAECRKNEIISILFEDNLNVEYYKKLRKDLIDTFTEQGVEDVVVISRGGLAIKKELVDCDYYDYMVNNEKFCPTEYMAQFSFAEGRITRVDE